MSRDRQVVKSGADIRRLAADHPGSEPPDLAVPRFASDLLKEKESSVTAVLADDSEEWLEPMGAIESTDCRVPQLSASQGSDRHESCTNK